MFGQVGRRHAAGLGAARGDGRPLRRRARRRLRLRAGRQPEPRAGGRRTRRRRPAAPGGNMEGKEVRFGIAGSAALRQRHDRRVVRRRERHHDSFTPLAGGMAMLNIALGEIIFGGVGSGLYGMLVFAILAVFIAGLMVGRTPEYLGKKIGPTDMKLAMLAVLALEAGILVDRGRRRGLRVRRASAMLNAGPARPVRDPLRGDLGGGQQRFRVRRAERERRRSTRSRSAIGDARRPLPLHRPGARHRRLDGAARRSRRRPPGTFPTDGPAVRRPARRRDRHRRRAHVLPGLRARARSSSSSSCTPAGSSREPWMSETKLTDAVETELEQPRRGAHRRDAGSSSARAVRRRAA